MPNEPGWMHVDFAQVHQRLAANPLAPPARAFDAPVPATLPDNKRPIFNQLLSGFSEIFPEAKAVVGGAPVRDLHLGINCAESIIIAVEGLVWEKKLLDQFMELGWGPTVADNPGQPELYQTGFHFNVLGCKVRLGLLKPNVMKAKTVFGFMGLNQMYYTTQEDVVVRPEAQKDIDNATITMYQAFPPAELARIEQNLVTKLKDKTGKPWKIIPMKPAMDPNKKKKSALEAYMEEYERAKQRR